METNDHANPITYAVLLTVLVSATAAAHHGSAISYDIANLWTTWAIVTEFNYKNPHPTMTFGGRRKTERPSNGCPSC